VTKKYESARNGGQLLFEYTIISYNFEKFQLRTISDYYYQDSLQSIIISNKPIKPRGKETLTNEF